MAAGAFSVKGEVAAADRRDHADLRCIAAFNLPSAPDY
jgi:hypothetical protein